MTDTYKVPDKIDNEAAPVLEFFKCLFRQCAKNCLMNWCIYGEHGWRSGVHLSEAVGFPCSPSHED